jgi:outer membrane lipoprotein LolB
MKIKNIYSLIYLSLFISIFSGCATQAPRNNINSSKQIYQEKIHITGRISIQYQENEQEQSLHGNFDWYQNSDDIAIELSSPLGQTIANITQNKGGASITEAKKPPRTAKDIEQLLRETVGWTIPVQSLRSWLQGFDTTASQHYAPIATTDNHIITSSGWQIRYASWQEIESITLPKRIDLTRTTQQMGELKIRIVIDEWKPIQ